MNMRSHQDIVERLRAEYLEMPGMHLKLEQVQRLCGIDRHVCEAVLAALVDARFLRVTQEGAYARMTDEPQARLRAAKADLRPRAGTRIRAAS